MRDWNPMLIRVQWICERLLRWLPSKRQCLVLGVAFSMLFAICFWQAEARSQKREKEGRFTSALADWLTERGRPCDASQAWDELKNELADLRPTAEDERYDHAYVDHLRDVESRIRVCGVPMGYASFASWFERFAGRTLVSSLPSEQIAELQQFLSIDEHTHRSFADAHKMLSPQTRSRVERYRDPARFRSAIALCDAFLRQHSITMEQSPRDTWEYLTIFVELASQRNLNKWPPAMRSLLPYAPRYEIACPESPQSLVENVKRFLETIDTSD